MLIFNRQWFHKIAYFPWMLFWGLIALSILGVVVLYGAAEGHPHPWALSHGLRCGVGAIILMALAFVDVKVYFKYSYIAYLVTLIILAAVAALGFIGMGAKRWINLYVMNIQPSELVKVSLILCLARYFHEHPLASWTQTGVAALLCLIPMTLILKQPDLGTAMIVCLITLIILWAMGVPLTFFLVGGIGIVLSGPILWALLKEYQKKRVLIFLNPDQDPLGAGYHLLQSKIALGSGRLWGRGFLQGSQSQLDFLPAKQTDFIFTMFGEEFGFCGGILLMLMYGFVLWRGYCLTRDARTVFTYVLAVGVNAFFFLHVVINMGMVMGLLPVVGVPLPLMSYGGSSVLTVMIAYGLVFSAVMCERLETPFRQVGTISSL